MGKIIMAQISINEEEMEMCISDVQRIDRVPEIVKSVIKNNVVGRRLNKSGLPSVHYLGPNRVEVVGAFTYGEISFLEINGKWTNIVEGEELVCITAYRPEKTYKELVEGKEQYLEELKEKYPEGIKVE